MNKNYPSIRIFKNPILEKLTHVHPITPLILWVPVIAYLYYVGAVERGLPWESILGWSLVGLIFWTLFEYLLHRYVFHFVAHTPLQERLQFLIHGLHHDDPVDPTRLVMPPVAGIFLAVLFFTLFRFVLGPVFIFPFFGAFLVGYLCYDYIHYSVHHFTPRTRIGKALKQSHMAHHFISHDSHWGVSSPLWDHVFGTIEEVKRVRHGS